MNYCTLIFPPQFEPFQPYLSLPVLSSALKAKGYDVGVFDFNVDYFNWVLKPSYLECSLQELLKSKNSKKCESFRGMKGEYILDNICKAMQTIREAQSFTDLPKYKWATNVLKMGLKMVSAKHDPSTVNFYEACCGTTNYESQRILDSITQERLNLFAEYINTVAIPTIDKHSPDFVGLSLVVHDQLAFTLTLGRKLKKLFPHIHLCVGGALISRLYNKLAGIPAISSLFDSFVIGEGEETICELVGAIKCHKEITNIPGVFIPGKENKFRKRKPTESVAVILPDFSGLPLKKYLSPFLVLPYLTSYGCHWGKCSFCCHHYPYGRYREKPEMLVVEQLAKLSKQYDTNYFSFTDEQITPERLKNLAEKFIDYEIDIKWFTFARMEKAFKQQAFCDLIYKAGCRTLMLGLESAVQRILDLMHKGTHASDFSEILSSCKKANISVRLDTMVGFPTETKEESDFTLDFLVKNKRLIDTPFSIMPLSLFELQDNSPIMRYPSKYDISPQQSMRGDLDYQLDYEIEQGMDHTTRNEIYKKYIQVLSLFDFADICPENKVHAFLMKCLCNEQEVVSWAFSEVMKNPSQYTPVFYQGILCMGTPSNCQEEVYLLSNLLNGIEVEIDSCCKNTVDLVKQNFSVEEILDTIKENVQPSHDNFDASFERFIRFIYSNEFIYFIRHGRQMPRRGQSEKTRKVLDKSRIAHGQTNPYSVHSVY